MPLRTLMTWQKDRCRWRKMFAGKMYFVTPKELGTSATKEGSTEAANDWWKAKQAELEQRPNTPAPGTHDALMYLLDRSGVSVMEFMALAAKGSLSEGIYDAVLGPERVAALTNGTNALLEGAKVEPERTIQTAFNRWQTIQLTQKKSPARKKMNIHMAKFFVEWLGPANTIDAINEDTWEGYWIHLQTLDTYDETYLARIQATARMFVEWLGEKKLIRLPANLFSKNLKFRKKKPKKIPAPKLPDVKTLLAKAKGQTKLHILLALNAGMNPKDISELDQSEVDWTNGTVTRERTKLKDVKDAPTICYKLWPETYALLKQWRSSDPKRVLLTKSGKPWVVNDIDKQANGKYKNSNSIASNIKALTTAIKDKKTVKILDVSPKQLRTAGSSMLAQHTIYKYYIIHYLADSPKGIPDGHYAPPSQKEFDEAIAWLRTQFIDA